MLKSILKNLHSIESRSMQCSVFNLPFQIAIYTWVITPTLLFFQFNFVVIFPWYSKKQDPRSCPGTIADKDWAILTRHSQIWYKACSFNHLTLNCWSFPHCLHLYFMQACVNWVLIIFETQVIKKKRLVWPVFPDYFPVPYDYKTYTSLLGE